MENKKAKNIKIKDSKATKESHQKSIKSLADKNKYDKKSTVDKII